LARINEIRSLETERERQLLAEVEVLRARLDEAESTLCAIRGGEVDAFVVHGPGGDDMVYTLGMSELLNQLRLITDALPVLISYVDQEGCLQFTNRQYEIWFRRSDFQGHHLRDVFGEAGYEALREPAEAALGGRKGSATLWVTIEPVGKRCVQATFVPHVHQGEVLGFVSLIDDITDRRRAEEALRESEERYRLVAQATNDVIWEWNLVTRSRLSYETGEVSLGAVEGPAPVLPDWLDRVHPEDRERISAGLRDVLEGRQPSFEEEYRFHRSDGAWIVVHDRGFLDRDEQGKPVRMIGSMVDITARKQAESDLLRAKEAAETANRAKDQFLATLSHELRTPLTPVLAMASLWERDRRLPADVQQGLAVIRRNIELEARLIDDLLDLTRIARGKLDLQSRETRLDEILAAALETCNAQEIRDKNLRIDADLLKMGYRLQADPARLTQVFWNLLRNAIKFSMTGGSIAVTPEERDGWLEVRVTDTGIGIESALLEQIFTAFDQGRPETMREFGGLGLGLAISRAIVELHGGRLLAASEGIGRGATFTVVLPLDQGILPAAESSRDEAPAPGPRRSGPGLRILLVEDHPDTAEAMGLLLSAAGHDVEVANTAGEALEKARSRAAEDGDQPFDLVVSDLGLPDLSGLDLMKSLAERYRLKGLALSGYGMEEDVKRSLEAGFRRHLTKPVTPDLLIRVVRELGEEVRRG
jgi:two-component system CheB/CheR fusion protein